MKHHEGRGGRVKTPATPMRVRYSESEWRRPSLRLNQMLPNGITNQTRSFVNAELDHQSGTVANRRFEGDPQGGSDIPAALAVCNEDQHFGFPSRQCKDIRHAHHLIFIFVETVQLWAQILLVSTVKISDVQQLACPINSKTSVEDRRASSD